MLNPTNLQRRHFLGAFSALAGSQAVRAAPAKTAGVNQDVHFTSDGVPLPPREYAQLLTRVTEAKDIAEDNYSREGIVAELEQRMAALLGKECAVFLPSGTLANHLAARIQANGHRVLVQQESHFYNDEGDCAQRLSALNLVPLAPGKGSFTLADVEEAVGRSDHGRVATPVGVISIESPVRRKSGEVFPFDEMKRITVFARQRGIRLHLDGARMFLAAPYTGVTPKQYSALFDTVYVSLYKYFNANFGAILAGPRTLLEDLYHTRRMFGGGLPHVWPEAAVALHFLDGFEGRYAKAVTTSEAFLARLSEHSGFTVQRITPGSNIAIATIPARDPAAYQNKLGTVGINVGTPKASKLAGHIELPLITNETVGRRSADELARAFVEAAGS